MNVPGADKTRAELLAEIEDLQQRVISLTSLAEGYHRENVALRENQEGYQIAGKSVPDRASSDVTERIGVLEQQRRLLEQVANTTPNVLYLYDITAQRYVYVNRQIFDILGYSQEEACSFSREHWLDRTHPEDLSGFRQHFTHYATAKDANLLEHECRMRHANGQWRWLHLRERVFARAENGAPQQILGTSQDVTERKRIEDLLRESGERYRIISQSISDYAFSFRIEDNGEVFAEWLTESFAKVTGYELNEVLGRSNPFCLYVHPDDVSECFRVSRVLRDGTSYSYEFRIVRKDGEVRWIRSYVQPVINHNGRLVRIHGAAQDVTEKKRAEEELRRQEALFRTLAESSAVSVFIYQGSRIRYMNATGLALLGYSYEELLEKELWDLFPPDCRDFVKTRGMQRLHGAPVPSQYEVKLLTKSGEERCMMFSGNRIEFEGQPAVLGTAFDVTERKRLEEEQRQLQQQLFQNQKLQSLGRLAGGIAHDFNNLLTPILGFAELTLADLPLESPLYRNIEEIRKAGKRAQALIQQILSFGRSRPQEHQTLSIQALIEETLPLLRASLPTTIDIHYHSRAAPAWVRGDATQLQQVLMNLCVNARDAMRETGGTLDIRLNRVSLNERFARQHDNFSPGPYLQLIIRDTGCGIPKEILPSVFDPFFTTKDVGVGSGLGLAIVHGIVLGHGGIVTAKSTLGRGSTFIVYLPQAVHAQEEQVKVREATPSRKGRVLFVDDEESVVLVGKRMLERCGYEVVATTSSQEALALFRQGPQHFVAVVTDQTMPELTGKELTKIALQLRPDIPVLLCTGCSETLSVEQARAIGIQECLSKPFSFEEMETALQRALAHAP
ncbi:MAG: PAS domain S-box protein [Candidatus Binatia bacterium]